MSTRGCRWLAATVVAGATAPRTVALRTRNRPTSRAGARRHRHAWWCLFGAPRGRGFAAKWTRTVGGPPEVRFLIVLAERLPSRAHRGWGIGARDPAAAHG